MAVRCGDQVLALDWDERKRKFKARYDRDVFLETFDLGDAVLMRDHVPAGKLEAKWIGPLTVTRVNRNGT